MLLLFDIRHAAMPHYGRLIASHITMIADMPLRYDYAMMILTFIHTCARQDSVELMLAARRCRAARYMLLMLAALLKVLLSVIRYKSAR